MEGGRLRLPFVVLHRAERTIIRPVYLALIYHSSLRGDEMASPRRQVLTYLLFVLLFSDHPCEASGCGGRTVRYWNHVVPGARGLRYVAVEWPLRCGLGMEMACEEIRMDELVCADFVCGYCVRDRLGERAGRISGSRLYVDFGEAHGGDGVSNVGNGALRFAGWQFRNGSQPIDCSGRRDWMARFSGSGIIEDC